MFLGIYKMLMSERFYFGILILFVSIIFGLVKLSINTLPEPNNETDLEVLKNTNSFQEFQARFIIQYFKISKSWKIWNYKYFFLFSLQNPLKKLSIIRASTSWKCCQWWTVNEIHQKHCEKISKRLWAMSCSSWDWCYHR